MDPVFAHPAKLAASTTVNQEFDLPPAVGSAVTAAALRAPSLVEWYDCERRDISMLEFFSLSATAFVSWPEL